MTCTQCGAALTADDVFCNKCGAHAAANLPVPADPQRAALERVLGHQYDILRLLGRGGMGAVYLAREKALERAVAIKVLPPETATDADTRERFRREARVAAKLTHPNIVPLHTFGDVEGMLYFVMGYVKGESLAERMRREGKLPEEDVRRIMAEVADALHYAHKQGVVHRDIKPDNILIDDESGRPMLTDFGVAKARASGATLTEVGAVVGTPYYMSPEQASGARDIDGRSDLYSLGVMGYQMLAGRLPFEGESFQDVIVQHVTREPAPLAALAPDAPADLTAAVMRCLAKEPAKRWADGHSLKDAIAEYAVADDSDPSAPGAQVRAGMANLGTLAIGAALWGWASWLHPGLQVPEAPWWAIPAVVLGLIPLAGAAGAVWEHRLGRSWRAILRFAMYPPRWHSGWWPARWRMPGDVWDRLPRVVRFQKAAGSVGLAGVPLAIAAMIYFMEVALNHTLDADRLANQILVGCAAWLGLPIISNSIFHRWGLARGLTHTERMMVLGAPSWKLDFWRKPKFAALLLPPSGRVAIARPAEPRSPDEYAQAIRDLVGQLPSGTQATVSEAADAARQLLGTVAALDAELAKLAQDADPQELEAVETKLRALGPETTDEGDVRRQKRALLVPQRDLLRKLDQRLAEVTERRARLLDLMRTMWLQVANLRAEAAHDTLAVTEISGRIKLLCTEIDAHVKAAETVRLEIR
jgi:serine/threonine-protein kinase